MKSERRVGFGWAARSLATFESMAGATPGKGKPFLPGARASPPTVRKVGRGSWRGRGEISGVGVSFKKKKRNVGGIGRLGACASQSAVDGHSAAVGGGISAERVFRLRIKLLVPGAWMTRSRACCQMMCK